MNSKVQSVANVTNSYVIDNMKLKLIQRIKQKLIRFVIINLMAFF